MCICIYGDGIFDVGAIQAVVTINGKNLTKEEATNFMEAGKMAGILFRLFSRDISHKLLTDNQPSIEWGPETQHLSVYFSTPGGKIYLEE